MGELLPRIGCVPYLNARPLIEGISFPISEMVPSKLWDAYVAGCFDVALLSSIDVISIPNGQVVDDVAIASRGDVHSVFLAFTGELLSIDRVRLDASSHTSNALLRIILGEFHGIHPEYIYFRHSIPIPETFSLPTLVIGDPAIVYRKELRDPKVQFLDLGGEWYKKTGLPFVYALWAFNNEYTKKKYLSLELRKAKKQGLSNLDGIAEKSSDPLFTLRYLSKWISYEFGENEKRGLDLFGDYLRGMNIITLKNKLSYW